MCGYPGVPREKKYLELEAISEAYTFSIMDFPSMCRRHLSDSPGDNAGQGLGGPSGFLAGAGPGVSAFSVGILHDVSVESVYYAGSHIKFSG